MNDINTLLQREKNILLLTNSNEAVFSHKGIDALFSLNRNLICLCLSPTYEYCHNAYLLDDADAGCYYEHILDKDMESDEPMKVNALSKYSAVKRAFDIYDNKTGKLSNTCPAKCSQCCNDIFFISQMEFLYILSDMMLRKKYMEMYQAHTKAERKMAYIRENFPVIYEQVMHDYSVKEMQYFNIGMSVQCMEKCPFLNKYGKCTAYDVRPVICRVYGTTQPCGIAGNGYKSVPSFKPEDIITLKHSGRRFISQNRTIEYFSAKYLSLEKIDNTMKILKSFTEDTEEEFFDKLRTFEKDNAFTEV